MFTELFLLMTTAISPQSLRAPADLKTQFERISRAAHSHVGAVVMPVETGESVSFHGDQHFPMQSVYKFPIGVAVLHEVDAGRLNLDQKMRVEKREMLPAGFH